MAPPRQNDPDLPDTTKADLELARYFEVETERLEADCLTQLDTAEDWLDKRDELRQQLKEMLGLDPMPEKTDLAVQVTAVTEHEDFLVRRLHYQSRPGLYVTGNLYVPRDVDKPLPAVLYVCGHGPCEDRWCELRKQGSLPTSPLLVCPQRLRVPFD